MDNPRKNRTRPISEEAKKYVDLSCKHTKLKKMFDTQAKISIDKSVQIEKLNAQIDFEMEYNNKLSSEITALKKQLESRADQLKDINQWSHLIIGNRDLTPRVVRGIVISINNRTTD